VGTGHANFYNPGGIPQFGRRIEERGGQLLLEASAENTNGNTCSELVWVDSAADLGGKGDLLLELDVAGETLNGAFEVKLSEGGAPENSDDNHSTALFTYGVERQSTNSLQLTHLKAEIVPSAALAIVEAGDDQRLISLPALKRWRLRFFARAMMSSGLKPAQARLVVNHVSVRRLPRKSGIICEVKDGMTCVYQVTEKGLERFKDLRADAGIDWPLGAAHDGKYLWFADNDWVSNRFRLVALDLTTGRIAEQLPTEDSQIAGLAWDRERHCFWVSSDSGHVYQVNRDLALEQHSLEAGKGREFDGYYHSLAYSERYLWGLDRETKRICKIKVSKD